MMRRHGYTLVQLEAGDALYVHESMLPYFKRLSTVGNIQALYATGYIYRDMFDGVHVSVEDQVGLVQIFHNLHNYYFQGRETYYHQIMQEKGITPMFPYEITNETASPHKTASPYETASRETAKTPYRGQEHAKAVIIRELWEHIYKKIEETQAGVGRLVPFMLDF
eukprot:GDKI01006938.1.p1 GENE.GDKI01006938.1~~GDKI01006938.1.p1  ORF type:complete len:182 (+),score=50.01 GDKI01006938.1:51-548(+)